MANTTSQSYSFDQDFSIDEIIADAYERLGLVGTAGHQIKSARRSLTASSALTLSLSAPAIGKPMALQA